MHVYAIVSPLLVALCDNTGNSRTRVMFPMMVVCVACCGILPLPTAIQQAGQFTGFMETYGFTGSFDPMYFLTGRWPVMVVTVLWALFIGPRFCPENPVLQIQVASKEQRAKKKLSPFADKIGIVIFFVTMAALIFFSPAENGVLVYRHGRSYADGSFRSGGSEKCTA